ncbi:hypothetical protein COCCADRAFT_105971, partial [Bipolaris zeicola 26-R-13]
QRESAPEPIDIGAPSRPRPRPRHWRRRQLYPYRGRWQGVGCRYFLSLAIL